MSAAVKPATPLPWVALPYKAADRERDVIERDDAYELHAANAYPKLVEALRYAANELDLLYAHAINNGISEAETPPHRMVRDILREIGEAE